MVTGGPLLHAVIFTACEDAGTELCRDLPPHIPVLGVWSHLAADMRAASITKPPVVIIDLRHEPQWEVPEQASRILRFSKVLVLLNAEHVEGAEASGWSGETITADTIEQKLNTLFPPPAEERPAPPVTSSRRRPRVSRSRTEGLIILGASTGGPRALQELLTATPADLNCPIVVVQHILPTFAPSFARWLSDETGHSFVQCTTRHKLTPDSRLVAPSDREIFFERVGGEIWVRPAKAPSKDKVMPVDAALCSAAPLLGEHLIAAVLTGMGQDGLAGARAVSRSGGVIVTQDQESSTIWGMPKAIAERGLSTQSGTPRALATTVTRFARNGGRLISHKNSQALLTESLRKWVLDETGAELDMPDFKWVRQRLGSLTRELGLPAEDLVRSAVFGSDAKQRMAVIDAILNHETSFFRNPRVFRVLEEHVLPTLARTVGPSRDIRIWSAACSDGQEAYSLAISCLRASKNSDTAFTASITGSDYSTRCIAFAQLGRYNQLQINRGLPARTLLRHFTREKTNWVASSTLRKMIRFRQINLVRDWPTDLDHDLVVIRNVLFYLCENGRRNVLEQLQTRVKPGGFVLFGQSENPPMGLEGFEKITWDRVSLFRRLG